MEFQVRYLALFLLFSVIESFEQFRMGSLHILGPIPYLIHINYLPEDAICDIAIYADDTTLYCKCDQAPDFLAIS